MASIRWALMALALLIFPAAWSGAALTQPDQSQQEDFLTGQLLMAAPDMGDPRFFHAVILMIHHDGNGASGIIVNHPLEEQTLARLLGALGQKNDAVTGSIEIYAGGPVEPDVAFVLHSADYKRPETIAIDGKIAVTSSAAVLRDIAGRNSFSPSAMPGGDPASSKTK
jgi:putative transcriptional regulator